MIHVTTRLRCVWFADCFTQLWRWLKKKHPGLKGLKFLPLILLDILKHLIRSSLASKVNTSSKKPTLTRLENPNPHPKTEQDSLHAPEICFKLLCSLLLETSCTTLIILTIRSRIDPLKKKHHLKGSRTNPLFVCSALRKVWFFPSNLQCSPSPQNLQGSCHLVGERLVGFQP